MLLDMQFNLPPLDCVRPCTISYFLILEINKVTTQPSSVLNFVYSAIK